MCTGHTPANFTLASVKLVASVKPLYPSTAADVHRYQSVLPGSWGFQSFFKSDGLPIIFSH